MVRMTTRVVVVVATAALALSACTSAASEGGPNSTQNGSPTSTQKAGRTDTPTPAPTPSVSADLGTKQALGDIKLGAIRIDAKSGTPSAEVTITNHSSRRSNYIVDLRLTSADGKTVLDVTMIAAPGLAPGQRAKPSAQFKKVQKLPAGAKLTIVGVARLVA